MKPIFIEKIVTMKGEVVEENSSYVEFEEREEEEEKPPEETYTPPPVTRERVISPQDAYIMTHLLEGVVQHGTGQGAKRLGRPVAGKTGTSSDFMDAWFIGYTPSLLASVWVGFDDKSSLGPSETGARAALPIWTLFMEEALKDMPVESFKVPSGITLMKIDLQTGEPPHEGTQEIVLEAFIDPQAMQSLGEISPGPRVDTGLPDAPVDSH
jgi:penicillin-binding protein 1A